MVAMIDTIAALWFFAFFGFLIYAVYKTPSRSPGIPPNAPPSPLWVFCSLCGVPATLVTSQDYMKLASTGTPVHCEGCLRTIEAYRKQTGELS